MTRTTWIIVGVVGVAVLGLVVYLATRPSATAAGALGGATGERGSAGDVVRGIGTSIAGLFGQIADAASGGGEAAAEEGES